MDQWPVGVFTSLDEGLGVSLDVVKELGMPSLQLHAPKQENRTKETAEKILADCADAGVTITCVFSGFPGESYASIQETAATVGLVPLETRQERAEAFRSTSEFAGFLGCEAVGMHIGFVPEDRDGDSYKDLIAVTRSLLDDMAKLNQNLHLETGQETADHLLEFMADVDRPNLYINFDPANMILYGTGDPIEALKKVAKHVRSVHCKDAVAAPPEVRGKEWGREVALGEGEVDIERYLTTLHEIGYTGPLTIEREIPEDRDQQKADVGGAMKLLEDLRAKILN